MKFATITRDQACALYDIVNDDITDMRHDREFHYVPVAQDILALLDRQLRNETIENICVTFEVDEREYLSDITAATLARIDSHCDDSMRDACRAVRKMLGRG